MRLPKFSKNVKKYKFEIQGHFGSNFKVRLELEKYFSKVG